MRVSSVSKSTPLDHSYQTKENGRNCVWEEIGKEKKEPVAQGQYVVSDTRCPALSNCESEGGEAGQRPRRGQSPVEHRGTFVRPGWRSG